MKNSILFAVLLLTVTACTKYEEGPAISFRRAEDKAEGNWQISSYTVDRVDSMQVIYDLHLEGIFQFVPHESMSDPPLRVTTVVQDTTYFYEGRWGKGGKKKTIFMSLSTLKTNANQPVEIPLGNQFVASDWKILRLKHEQDMWLELDRDGKRYELKFKSI